jgi:hypothetical protein
MGMSGGWAAFASKANLTATQDGSLQVGWVHYQPYSFEIGQGLGYVSFSGATLSADCNITGEMIAQHTDNNFWVLFSSSLNEVASSESFGISNIEIWVQ